VSDVLVAIVSTFGLIAVAYIGNTARVGKNNAAAAAKFAEPTGNGFARKVLEKLDTNQEHNEDTAEQLRELRLDVLELFKRDAIDHDHNRKTDEFIARAEPLLVELEERTQQ
jgi:hypothetical protein